MRTATRTNALAISATLAITLAVVLPVAAILDTHAVRPTGWGFVAEFLAVNAILLGTLSLMRRVFRPAQGTS
jgi:hypothetical protein